MRDILSILIVSGAFLSGCAQTSTMPLNANTVRISVSAAPICGMGGAQKVALQMAAIETIRKGFDKFVIFNGQYQANPEVVGYSPMTAQTHTFGNSSYTTVSGGGPIVMSQHNQGITVRMFKQGQQGSDQALSAKDTLGKKWKELVKEGVSTCS